MHLIVSFPLHASRIDFITYLHDIPDPSLPAVLIPVIYTSSGNVWFHLLLSTNLYSGCSLESFERHHETAVFTPKDLTKQKYLRLWLLSLIAAGSDDTATGRPPRTAGFDL